MRSSLHLLDVGPLEADVLMFLHGGGLSAHQWHPQLKALNGYRCLAPDLPEHGLSRALGPFELHDAVERVLHVLVQRSPGQRVHLIGSSLGGAVALQVLRVAPKLVQSVFITGTAAGLSRRTGQLTLAAAPLVNLIPKEWLLQASERQFRVPTADRAAFREDLRQALNIHTQHSLTRALMNLQLPISSNVRVLALVGSKETWTAKRAARHIARLMPQGQAVEVPQVGHLWNLEAPDLFTATVQAWVEGKPLPPPLRPLATDVE
ncbi:alpha/beta fold hydrolase [Deinococcus arcticus]|uniref:AB hydrolase-1 domain-containing protein n=1 Tax=Deinococcus arcticus TaxID=2136176 RepID=A0A2T3W3S1_9DEIO|nr:alpha/beta fold hydrolase [Deinococcus arcticus]PTA66546.1 hypothetical protein C8263_17310 [Deinococcus arcticus]